MHAADVDAVLDKVVVHANANGLGRDDANGRWVGGEAAERCSQRGPRGWRLCGIVARQAKAASDVLSLIPGRQEDDELLARRKVGPDTRNSCLELSQVRRSAREANNRVADISLHYSYLNNAIYVARDTKLGLKQVDYKVWQGYQQ